MDPSDVMEQLSSLLYSYSHSPFATALLSAYEKHHLKNSLKSAKSKDQIIELTSKLNAIDLLYLGCNQSNARKERLKNVENSVQARLEKKQAKVDNLNHFRKSTLTLDKILKMWLQSILFTELAHFQS
ncbi:hypothetical protein BKA69DRAFT_394432 [Paraphysoderma sedebokerense]|nr:hypothetical protein BKA69DRAFT_394432 [Paraphysoderma sedebokerense]